MNKFTSKCTIGGCGRSFTNSSQGLSNANLANHMKWHQRENEMAQKQPGTAGDISAPVIKKKYQKKVTAAYPNYCPGCGCNIRAVAAAMSL